MSSESRDCLLELERIADVPEGAFADDLLRRYAESDTAERLSPETLTAIAEIFAANREILHPLLPPLIDMAPPWFAEDARRRAFLRQVSIDIQALPLGRISIQERMTLFAICQFIPCGAPFVDPGSASGSSDTSSGSQGSGLGG